MHTHAPIGAVAVGRVPESADFATDFATERRPTSADAAIIGVWVRPFSYTIKDFINTIIASCVLLL